MSPLQYSLLDEKESGVDLLIATEDSIMYCDRKAIVVPPMQLYATDLWKVIGSRKDTHPGDRPNLGRAIRQDQ
jgi:hypothetical protein